MIQSLGLFGMAILLIMGFFAGAAQNKQVLTLPATANWLTTDGARVYALLENNQVLQIEKSSQTFLGKDWSSLAPIIYAHGRLHGISTKGELLVYQNKQFSSSQLAKLSTKSGVLSLPAGVIAVNESGDIVRLEPNGKSWEIIARAALNALTDQVLGFADLEGDNDREVVALVGANSSRYQHGILGDRTEATSIVALERHSLKILWRYDLAASYVFEDIQLRTFKLGSQEELVTVRAGIDGGAALAMLGLYSGKLELRTGAALGVANRWLNPIVGASDIFAIHTPHIGGILFKYNPKTLNSTRQLSDLSNHAIGSRNLEPSMVLASGELILPSQNHQIMKTVICDSQCRVVRTYDLGAAFSSNIIVVGQNKVIAANNKLHLW